MRWAFASAVAASMAFAPVPSIADESTADRSYNTIETLSRDYAHPTLASNSTEPVAIQLGLAMDTSGSMSNEEYALQLRATAHALNSRVVRSVIKSRGSVGLFVVDFGSSSRVRIPWVDIRAEDINDYPNQNMGYRSYYGEEIRLSAQPDVLDRFVQEILALPRLESGSTRIWTAMQQSQLMFENAPWMPTEGRVLDIFGDGTPDSQSITDAKRAALAGIGVTINGFAIVNDVPTLEENYKKNVVTQTFNEGSCFSYSFSNDNTEKWCIDTIPGRVWAMARNVEETGNTTGGVLAFYDDVTSAMRQKISVEIAGLDEYLRILAETEAKPVGTVPTQVREPS